jgi:hypothetical protein
VAAKSENENYNNSPVLHWLRKSDAEIKVGVIRLFSNLMLTYDFCCLVPYFSSLTIFVGRFCCQWLQNQK